MSGQTQADYTVRAYQFADRNWPWAGPMFLWNLNWSLYPPGVNAWCSHMRWFSVLRADGTPVPVFHSVANMPRRYSDYLPRMTLYAHDMTVEVSAYCPVTVLVGTFDVANGGYPGTFSATVEGIAPPGGPVLDVFPQVARSGDTVQIYADTTGLEPGLHTIYINVTATIDGQTVGETIQGYIVVNEVVGDC